MNAKKMDWLHWFRQGKAFATVDNRSYAQVLKSTSVHNTAKLVDKKRTKKADPKVNLSFNAGPVNRVVNLTVTKPKQINHRPSVNGAKHPHTDTVSTHNRFQVLENLHTDGIEVLVQSSLPSDTFVNSVSSLPSSAHASTKVPKPRKLMNKNYKNYPTNSKSHTGESLTVVSDVTTDQSLSTALDNEVNALQNTDPNLFSVSNVNPPPLQILALNPLMRIRLSHLLFGIIGFIAQITTDV